MGKLKEELNKIYHKKREKALQQLKLFEEGKINYEQLNRLARKIFNKRIKAGYQFPKTVFFKKIENQEKSHGGVA
jgi:glutamyl-tRNA reductase